MDAARQLRELADRIEEVEDSKMELLQQVNLLTAEVRAAEHCCQWVLRPVFHFSV